MAGMYAVYHGTDGLKRNARRVHGLTAIVADALSKLGCEFVKGERFYTIRFKPMSGAASAVAAASSKQLNVRVFSDDSVGVSLDEAERQLILRTLIKTGNNKTRAAELLRISLKTLHNQLKTYREDI